MDQFLQSKNWQEFQKLSGHEVFEAEGIFCVIKKMKFGLKHLYISRHDLKQEVFDKIKKIAIENKCDFIRYEPISQAGVLEGFEKVKDFQPSKTLLIDLSKDIEVLESELHPKTRYNISLAKRRDVSILVGGEELFEEFWRLISLTYIRKGIKAHTKKYYFNIIKNDPDAYIAVAKLNDGQVIAANLMLRYGNTVTYLHGGSDSKFKSMMAPQLLQWSEILRAKNDGLKYYDFWGIAPNDDPNHPWAGITRFKKGFGGFTQDFPGTYELALSWKYRIYKFLNKLR